MKIKKFALFVNKNSVQMKIIKKEFKKMQKVRDHCHYTGKYRGAAHSSCNLTIKYQKRFL